MLRQLQKISKGIESNLILLILLSIAAGVAFGWRFPDQAHGLKGYSKAALFIMLYPMMIGLRIEEVGKAAANLKLLSLSMLFNFVLSPLLAAGLAYVFLHSRPDFAVGLILTGTVPCAGMVAGWTGYAKGNVALAMVVVALSLLVSIVMIPIWMPILAGVYVQLDAWAMFKDILITVVVPLILGDLTRRLIIRWKSPADIPTDQADPSGRVHAGHVHHRFYLHGPGGRKRDQAPGVFPDRADAAGLFICDHVQRFGNVLQTGKVSL